MNAHPTLVPGFTWTHLGQQSAAAFLMGPAMETDRGWFRYSGLFVHAPGTSDPFACIPGLVAVEENAPIRIEGEAYLLEFRPAGSRMWGEVADDSELEVDLRGLF